MSDAPERPARKKRGQSPTSRSLALLRKLGYTAGVVEKRLPFGRVTVDLFGCIDIAGIRADVVGVLGVQATSGANHASRRTKAIAEPRLRTWLQARNQFEVWSWMRRGARGARKLWEVRREALTLADLPAAEEEDGGRPA